MEDAIIERFSRDEFDSILQTYIQRLRGIIDIPENADDAAIDEAVLNIKKELLSDAYAGINAFGAHAERYQDVTREIVSERGISPNAGKENAAATERTNGPPDSGARDSYSVNDEYASEIDEWDASGRPSGEVFILGATGDVLQGLGAMENDIYMLSDKINTIISKHPEMTLNEIKRIPEILDEPILVLKSKNYGRDGKENSRLIIFGDVKAQNDKPVLSVLDLMPSEKRLRIEDMQKVNSAYTKDNRPAEYIMQSDVLYLDKKRAPAILRRMGFKMPIGLLRDGSIGSIIYGGNNVKMSGVPMSEVVDAYRAGGEQSRSEALTVWKGRGSPSTTGWTRSLTMCCKTPSTPGAARYT